MKLLLDLLPVILFFAAFKLAGMQPEAALAMAQTWLGPLMIDGQVPAGQAPIMLATAVAIVASLIQVGWQMLRRKKVDTMLWISVAVIVVFGGATIWLHDETFIKWKPSILYWLFGSILLGGRLLAGRNLLRAVLGEQLVLPAAVWERLLWVWIAFFATIGAVNLIVAFSVPTETWVNFKLFGLMGITFAFTLGIGLWLARHMKEAGDA
ncbi:MAG: septation protein A [Burkholderiaceae bacterium]|jgi:intracellular septation protein|nr:septation protein A [Burkholderiaceae bacterium]